MATTPRRAATTATEPATGRTTAKAPPSTGTGGADGTTTLAEAREEAASGPGGPAAGSPSDGAAGDGTTTLAEAREEAAAAAEGTAAAGSAAGGALRQVLSAPVTVARDVADDVASTLRRPDAVLYLAGVVGLAALGVVEWPVVAVAGVGLAIANGRRRGRT
jgi:hypothetical protein